MSNIVAELYHDNFQNYKRYNIPKAQLVIADIPYNIGVDAYASNPMWYEGGDNKNGESRLAKKAFFQYRREIQNSRIYALLLQNAYQGAKGKECCTSYDRVLCF